MKTKAEQNRHRIITAAEELFYHRGYAHTSFSDIAGYAHLSRGNFYYYFKSKESILRAVIDRRKAEIKGLLVEYEQYSDDPRERLRQLVQLPCQQKDQLMRYGCPFGAISYELTRVEPELQTEVRALFSIFVDWAVEQIKALGHLEDAQSKALHILVRMQGTSVMAQVYQDETLIANEVRELEVFIDSL